MNELQRNIKLGSGGISSLLGGFLETEKKQKSKKKINIVEDWLRSISTEILVAYLLHHAIQLHHRI